MDYLNKPYKKIIKKKIEKLNSFYNQKSSICKSSENISSKTRLIQKYKSPKLIKGNIIPKNSILTNIKKEESKNSKISFFLNFKKKSSLKFPSYLQKSAIINILRKNNSARNIFRNGKDPQKIDSFSSTTENFFFSTCRRISNMKSNFFKDLVENMSKKNIKDIDYILESPHRGLQKMCSSMSKSIYVGENKSKFRPFFRPNYIKINGNRFSLKKMNKFNAGIFDKSDLSLSKNENRNLFKDKYIEIKKNRELDNPFEKISKLSGVSCYKLRKAIDYSLEYKLKNFAENKIELNKVKNEMSKFFFNKKKNKKTYSIIALKHNLKNNNEKFNESDIDISFENIILSKKGKNMRH